MKITKTVKEFHDILYHATSSYCIEELKEGILIEKGLKNLDFGQGFYLTANYEQAKEWATRKGKVVAGFNNDPSIHGAIFVYKLDADMIMQDEMKVKIFSEENAEWAKFIFNNRSRSIIEFEEQGCSTDIIFGPLGDGRTGLLVRQLQQGKIGFSQFKRSLKGHKRPFPMDHQYSFHTKKALKALQLIEILEV